MATTLFPTLAGWVVGFLVGMTGMGGGALMTPFLILIMKLDPVMAVGTDLVFAAVTKISGTIQHRREENVEIKSVLWMALGSLPASWLGARLILGQAGNLYMTERVLPGVLGSILIIVSLVVLARTAGLLGSREQADVRRPHPAALAAIGAIGGFLVGISSVGGGTVIMALLLIFFSIPLHLMVGLDVAHGAILTTVPAATYALAGQTDWALVGWLLLGSIPGVWMGAYSVNRIDRRIVRGVLGVLILGAGVYMFFSQFP
ncbi:MAG: sulfite exporter TauE/SafE family protein [Anaerolineales bacterium]